MRRPRRPRPNRFHLEATQGQISSQISHRCARIPGTSVWRLTLEAIDVPISCIQGGVTTTATTETPEARQAFKAHRRVHHSTLGPRVVKKKKKQVRVPPTPTPSTSIPIGFFPATLGVWWWDERAVTLTHSVRFQAERGKLRRVEGLLPERHGGRSRSSTIGQIACLSA